MNPQQVTISSVQPPLSVTGLRGTIAPIPEGGYGGWNTVARPRRKSLTQWDGIDPLAMVFSIILDGVGDDRSIEAEIDRLERMAQPPSEGAEPPIVRVDGVMLHAAKSWVIGDLEWAAEQATYSRSGYCTRQEITVHLIEYVADDRLVTKSAAERVRRRAAQAAATASKGSGSPTRPTKAKLYEVRSGDTLSSIAARVLGSYTRWPEIASLNDLHDPDRLAVGQRLRLP
jgi:hypothetical protein